VGLRARWQSGDRFLIHHRDRSIVVVDKKAGVLTVKRPSERGVDLMTLVTEVLGGDKHGPRVYPVHRLDRPVSGLLVIARSSRAASRLADQLRDHSMTRRYVACVEGLLAEDAGRFESRLASRDATLRVRSQADDEDGGRVAVTRWRVRERVEATRVTVVEVELETGLRNQIRVHFAEAGHPLLGEKKYLDVDADGASSSQGTQRVFLHAEHLAFDHPDDGHRVAFDAPMPPDLERWLERLRAGEALRVMPRRKTAMRGAYGQRRDGRREDRRGGEAVGGARGSRRGDDTRGTRRGDARRGGDARGAADEDMLEAATPRRTPRAQVLRRAEGGTKRRKPDEARRAPTNAATMPTDAAGILARAREDVRREAAEARAAGRREATEARPKPDRARASTEAPPRDAAPRARGVAPRASRKHPRR
jgi:23S rRNA pseudouridine1911/1915/1917 synthase